VTIENFRIFRPTTTVQLSDLTALIGRNDIGKSSVLEALELFFEGEHVQIDADDPTKGGDSKQCRIACEFCDLPSEVVIDVEARTSLRAEHLLNSKGNLQIEKVFDCSKSKITPQVFARAMHPRNEGVNNLLSLKIPELRALFRKLKLDEHGVNQASKPDLRRAIWANTENLALAETLIPLGAEDAKAIWAELQKTLPQFALFQADRASKDNDAEVQDPMKVAVKSVLSEVEAQLLQIREQIKTKATEVAKRTVEKLKELDPSLARELSPTFSGSQNLKSGKPSSNSR
jgi:putative ATP-dependent endonuclease of the OLD family